MGLCRYGSGIYRNEPVASGGLVARCLLICGVLVTLLPWGTLHQAYQEGSNINFFVDPVLQHQSIIVRCYTDYEGDGWLAYDREFRRKAAHEKCLDWSQLNVSFYQFCLAGNAKKNVASRNCKKPRPSHTADCMDAVNTPQRSGYRRPDIGFIRPAKSGGVEICRLFNAKGESKCKYRECQFEHLCKFCKWPHPASNCPGTGKPEKRSRSS